MSSYDSGNQLQPDDSPLSASDFDVFLSYNRKNFAEAKELVRLLRQVGVEAFWDQNLLPGRRWEPALERILGTCRAVIVLLGSDLLDGWHAMEAGVALDRQNKELESGRDMPVIPVLLPKARPLPPFLGQNTAIDLQKGLTDAGAIERLIRAIGSREREGQKLQADLLRELICPYRGLAAFREADAEFFFGRDKVVSRLIKDLEKSLAVALVGPSGSGKSSVVHAGLIPELRKAGGGKAWSIVTMRPSRHPLRALLAGLLSIWEPEASISEKQTSIETLARALQDGALDLSNLILEGQQKQPEPGRLLLVVDQWEELYTLDSHTGENAQFISQINRSIAAKSLSILCTIRRDFVARALDEELGDRLERSLVYLGRMTPEELTTAVDRPADRAGLKFQPGLIERIIEDVGDEPGQLPLLEFVLTELWSNRTERLLRHDDYEKLGGARRAIASRAEEVFGSFSSTNQEKARRLLMQLVRPGEGTQDSRRRLDLDEVGEEAGEILTPLVEARLLTTNIDLAEPKTTESPLAVEKSEKIVEITHEALITHWKRFRTWLNEDRDFIVWRERLRMSRIGWERSGHDSEFLITHAPLAEAEKWLAEKRHDLSDIDTDYIVLSLVKHQQGIEEEFLRQQRIATIEAVRKRRQIWGVILLAVFCFGLAVFGLWRWRLSLSRALAAEASQLNNGPLDSALLLGVEAGNVYDTLEARSSLLSLMEQSQELQAFLPGHKGRVSRVAFSPDGRHFATAGSGKIFLWDADTGLQIGAPFLGHVDTVLDLTFSPDGSTLASCGKDKTIRLWRLGDHQPLRPPIDVEKPVRNLIFSPDGTILVASQAGSILLWEYPSLQPRERIEAHKDSISRLAFRKDGLLAAASYDKTISLWRVEQHQRVLSLSGHKDQVLDIAFSPDGRTLASGGGDKTIRLWDLATGIQLGEPIAAHRDAVLSIAFSTDGTTLASSGLDKVIHLWSVANSRLEPSSRFSKTLVGHGKGVWTLAFGKADRLVSGGDEASAILWNLKAPPRFSVQVQLSAEIDSVAFSPDGTLVATGGHDGVIRLWDTVSGRLREPVLQSRQGGLYGLALRGGKLYSAGEDGRILIWDLEHLQTPPEELQKADGANPAPIASLALSPDGKTLAAGDEQGRVRLWQVAGSQYLGEMPERDRGAVYGLSYSPDGLLLCAGGAEGLIRVWDAKSRRLVTKPLKGHDSTITGLAFDPTGQTLASSSTDRTVRLWDVKSWTLQPGSPLTGPESFLTAVAFSPKGDRLTATVFDGSIFLWDVKHRLPIGSGLRGTGKAFSVAFHPNGRYLAVGTESSLLLFDLRYETWRDQACRIAGRNLTHQEWNKYLPYEPYRKTCPTLPSPEPVN